MNNGLLKDTLLVEFFGQENMEELKKRLVDVIVKRFEAVFEV